MWRQNILQALRAIKGNRLRSALTILIIAFGITAIVGVLTSIDGIKYWMRSSFSTLGANTFVVQNRTSNVRVGGNRERTYFRKISFEEAQELKNRLEQEEMVANVNGSMDFDAVAKHRNRTTENNIRVKGSDENFLAVEAYELNRGRTITAEDVEQHRKVCIIGSRLREEIFPYSNPVGKHVFVGRNRFLVVGLLEERGTAFGSPGDRVVILPITTALDAYTGDQRSLKVTVYVERSEQLHTATQTAEGLFRIIRENDPGEESDFGIVVSDSFVNNLMENLRILTLSATIIALITLFGASIGLMNIMLVSVTERTREIGLRKSIGATNRQIQAQFLTEAVTITQLGGLAGILFGVGIGNLVGVFLDTPFFIPWGWVIMAIFICFLVGIVSGWYPARKAARLDPIESLRHE